MGGLGGCLCAHVEDVRAPRHCGSWRPRFAGKAVASRVGGRRPPRPVLFAAVLGEEMFLPSFLKRAFLLVMDERDGKLPVSPLFLCRCTSFFGAAWAPLPPSELEPRSVERGCDKLAGFQSVLPFLSCRCPSHLGEIEGYQIHSAAVEKTRG